MINFEAILMKNKGRKEEKQNMNVRRNNVPGGYDVGTSNSQTDKPRVHLKWSIKVDPIGQ